MDTRQLLLKLRLARPARRRGFCPACGIDVAGTAVAARGMEVAAGGVTVAVVIAVAAAAWAVTAWQMLSSGMAMSAGTGMGSDTTMSLGPIWSFATVWTEMMAAMVLVGMSSLTWTVVLAALVLVYKFAPLKGWWLEVALAAVVAGLGIAYAVLA